MTQQPASRLLSASAVGGRRAAVPRYDVADPAAADVGAAAVEWAERSMPVLRAVRSRFARERPLEGVRVSCCLHVTAETGVLVRTLLAGGAAVSLCAANPLSTHDDVAAALALYDGVEVHARHGADRAVYAAHVDAVLEPAPQLLLDDGCDLVTRLHTGPAHGLAGVRAGCEQTATGVLRLRQLARDGGLRLPMVAVDDTPTQRLVANRWGTGQSTVDAILRSTNRLLAGSSFVVAGYGEVGRGIAARAAGLGAVVVVTEVDPLRALDATMQGFRVMPIAAALPGASVVVTATGNRGVIGARHLELLGDGVLLVNAGHFDVEIDVLALSAAATDVRRAVRPHVDEYLLADGRRILLVAQGRLANLAAAEGHPPAVMDISFADQALSLGWLAGTDLPVGVHAVPAEIDEEVARLRLAATGVAIDALTPEQEDYLTRWSPPAAGG